MNTLLIRSFYRPQICMNLSLKYPWGWKSKYYKQKIITSSSYDINLNNNFKEGSEYAYKKIYNTFIENKDFLNYCYTSPNLSNVLNDIRSSVNIDNLENNIEIRSSKILNIWNVNDFFYNNHKILGLYNNHEIFHQLSAGIIGPEVRHIWDQQPSKQIVRVLFESNKCFDIVDFESDKMLLQEEWQICNINEIIVN